MKFFSSIQSVFTRRTFLACLLFLCIPITTHADALDDAKRALQIGEQGDGYIGAVKPGSSAELLTLINEINSKRRARYTQIAGKNNISLHDVEVLAAKKTLSRTQTGHMVKAQTGGWYEK